MENTFSRFNPDLGIVSMSIAFMIATCGNAQCLPHWEPVGIPDTTGSVTSMIWHDDGSGPSLFVGGAFGSIAGVPSVNIGRVSNGAGHPLGAGFEDTVRAMAVFDDGTGAKLYAGSGSYSQFPSSHLRVWNGSAWADVGGVNGYVCALATHNDGSGNALFVGGNFTSAGGIPVSNIARWNGTMWNSVGGGVTSADSRSLDAVRTLQSRTDLPTPILYVAGRVIAAGGVAATPVVAWNGSAWSNVGNEATGNTTMTVYSLAMYDQGDGFGPYLHRATTSGVKYLSGSLWTGSFMGVSPALALCVVHDSNPRGTLYIGTTASSQVNGQYVYRGLLKFDGTTTTGAGLILGGECASLQELPGGVLAVGGTFSDANGVPARNIATYAPASGWQSPGAIMHGGSFTTYVQSDDRQAIYFGAGQPPCVSRLVGNSLVPLPIAGYSGVYSGFTNDLELFGPRGIPTLVSAGYMSTPRFGASLAWQNDLNILLPSRFNNTTQSASSSDVCLSQVGQEMTMLMGGRFRITTDTLNHGILRYSSTGISSVAVDPHANFWVAQLATHVTPEGEYIYALDYGVSATQPTTLFVLSPAGVWTAIPGTLTNQGSPSVYNDMALAWVDDNEGGHLYIGGDFDAVNGQPAHRIARLNGSIIEPLPQGVDGPGAKIRDIVGFDDGTGPALYAAGRFETAGGVNANNIARFQNGQWSAVGGGVTIPTAWSIYYPPIYHLKAVSDSTGDWLYATGTFMVADGQYSPKVARYGRCRCPSDFNHDNAVDFFDYLDFVQAFAAGDLAADFNNDSVIDFFDYLDFVQAFSTGC